MTSVLAVCTGNVCRSPAAERLLAARLAGMPDLVVGSAGTGALVGAPIDPPMAELVRAAGAVDSPFAARRLTAAHVRAADLVLVMTRRHRSAVVALEPAAVRRTFLLRELAALAGAVADAGWPAGVEDTPAARLAALPGLAATRRGTLPAAADLEVVDPHRLAPEVYRQAMAEVTDAVDALAAAVTRPAG